MNFSRNRGFTLVEFATVTAIVGILSTIALPAYQSFINRAKAAELLLSMDKLNTALSLVQAERGLPLGSKITITPNNLAMWDLAPNADVNASPLNVCLNYVVRDSVVDSSLCKPAGTVPGISRTDLIHKNLGIKMDVLSGYVGADKPGEYAVYIHWKSTQGRAIAQAAFSVMSRQAFATKQTRDAYVLYFRVGGAAPPTTPAKAPT